MVQEILDGQFSFKEGHTPKYRRITVVSQESIYTKYERSRKCEKPTSESRTMDKSELEL